MGFRIDEVQIVLQRRRHFLIIVQAGVSSILFIGDNAAALTKAAGILGVMVVGGLIPSYVSFAFPESLVVAGGGFLSGTVPRIRCPGARYMKSGMLLHHQIPFLSFRMLT